MNYVNKAISKAYAILYHDIKKYKWKQLDINYELENIRPANKKDIEKAKKILEIS